MRLRITTAPTASTPCTWNTDFAISSPIVLTSHMDGSPQCGVLDATPLWHFDAVERAPSTASNADICSAQAHVRFTPKATSNATHGMSAKGQKRTLAVLFDHLVGAILYRLRHG